MKKLVALLLILWLVPSITLAAVEDFTTYTEVDPNGDLTITSTQIDVSTERHDADAYVYYDKGVNYFSGDFTHHTEAYLSNTTGDGYVLGVWGMWNAVGSFYDLYTTGNSGFHLDFQNNSGSARVNFYESDSGSVYGDYQGALSFNTLYYFKIVRDENVGTYGTIYAYVYSDSARTDLLVTASVALHTSKKDFRDIYGHQGQGAAPDAGTATGYTQNLDLAPSAPTTSGEEFYDVE